jgi:hypothetical protein
MQPSERRTIARGATVSAVALALVFGVIPFAHRWGERESLIAARRDQLRRMQQAVADTAAVRRAYAEGVAAAARWPVRMIIARSAEVALAVLQAQLRGWSDRSGVQVSRVESAPTDAGEVRLTVTAVADAAGLSALLDAARSGPHAVSVRALEAHVNPVLRAPSPLLNVALTIAAPWRHE